MSDDDRKEWTFPDASLQGHDGPTHCVALSVRCENTTSYAVIDTRSGRVVALEHDGHQIEIENLDTFAQVIADNPKRFPDLRPAIKEIKALAERRRS